MTLPKNHHKNPAQASNLHPILRVPFTVGPDAQEFTIERVSADTFVAHFSDKDLCLTAAAGTPRTRDLDFATWLGFERPRKVRELIRRMESSGKLRGVEWRPTVGRRNVRGDGVQEFTVTEAWLTREQALLVATQSDTPRAWALVEVMVKVFDGVLEMLRTPSASSSISAAEIAQMLDVAVGRATAPLREEIAALRASTAPALLGECIGRRTAREELAKPVRALASRLVLLDPVLSRKQHIGRLYLELRDAIGVSLAPRLEDLSAAQFAAARSWVRARNRGLDSREDAIRGHARRKAVEAQGSLGIN